MLCPTGKDIVEELEKTAYRYGPSRIFEDWLKISRASLRALPAFIQSQAQKLAYVDSPEDQRLWAERRERYPRPAWDHFTAAFAHLLESSQHGYHDTVGEIFMSWGNPNPRSGQFFTPMPVARMMAEVSMGGIQECLMQKLMKASEDNPAALAIAMVGTIIQDPDEKFNFFMNRLLPLIAPKLEPVVVLDPCVGSGVMLLAAAAASPRWALDLGLIQFYGVDIDPLCCQMAEVNLMLYGLNGFGAKCAQALSDAGIETLTGQYSDGYLTAKQTNADCIAVGNGLRQMQPDQRLLFPAWEMVDKYLLPKTEVK